MSTNRFRGQVAVVTGATGGLGQVLVQSLAEQGADIVLTGRSEPACQQLAQRVRDLGVRAIALAGDLRDPQHCEALIQAAVDELGGVDLLFNNAGTIPRGTIQQTSDKMWDTAIDLNLGAAFRLSRAAINHMAQHGGGAIVNVSSVWGVYPGPGHLAYCTAKGAVAAMTKALGRDHAPQNIRVNAVCPNEVDTPMLREGFVQRGLDPASAIEQLDDSVPLGHVASPQEIVDVMLFLASDEARYMAGATVEVTGAKPVY